MLASMERHGAPAWCQFGTHHKTPHSYLHSQLVQELCCDQGGVEPAKKHFARGRLEGTRHAVLSVATPSRGGGGVWGVLMWVLVAVMVSRGCKHLRPPNKALARMLRARCLFYSSCQATTHNLSSTGCAHLLTAPSLPYLDISSPHPSKPHSSTTTLYTPRFAAAKPGCPSAQRRHRPPASAAACPVGWRGWWGW